MRVSALILLVAVIFVSGCIEGGLPPPEMSNLGVRIVNLSLYSDTPYDDKTTTIVFSVENKGAKEVSGDHVSLFVQGPTVEGPDGNVSAWKVVNAYPGSFEQNGSYAYTQIPSVNLHPLNGILDLPGGSQSFRFEFQAPDIRGSNNISANFVASICYPYYTERQSLYEIISENELRQTVIWNSLDDMLDAAGPIQLEFKRPGKIFFIGDKKEFEIVLGVRDFSDGFSTLPTVPCIADTNTSDRMKVFMDVTVDGEPAECGDRIIQIKDGLGTLYCTKILEPADIRSKFIVVARATYNYYTEKSASIKVINSASD